MQVKLYKTITITKGIVKDSYHDFADNRIPSNIASVLQNHRLVDEELFAFYLTLAPLTHKTIMPGIWRTTSQFSMA